MSSGSGKAGIKFTAGKAPAQGCSAMNLTRELKRFVAGLHPLLKKEARWQLKLP